MIGVLCILALVLGGIFLAAVILDALDAWTLRRIDRMVDDWEREGRP